MDGEQLMMVPHELRQKILVENHDVPIAGHVGINGTVDLIKRNYWWRGIWGDVTAYVQSYPVFRPRCAMRHHPVLWAETEVENNPKEKITQSTTVSHKEP